MRLFFKRTAAGLCSLTLLASLLCASAASAPVHVKTWMGEIWVDGQDVDFQNNQGLHTYLFSCNGTIYMPADTAALWLGCQLSVNQNAAAFTSSGESRVPGPNSTPPLEDNDIERLNRYSEQGVDVQLLTNFDLTLNGERWILTAGNGTPLYPFFIDGTLYLPIRNVGMRMGKDVLWVPSYDLEKYYKDTISIDTPVTPEQLVEMQTYLDKCFNLYWQKAKLAEEFLAADTMEPTLAVQRLEQLKALSREVAEITEPSYPYLQKFQITFYIRSSTLDHYIQGLQAGSMTYIEAKEKGMPYDVNMSLLAVYRNLNLAQKGLDALVAAKGGNPS